MESRMDSVASRKLETHSSFANHGLHSEETSKSGKEFSGKLHVLGMLEFQVLGIKQDKDR